MDNPFKLTGEEKDMMGEDWRRPVKKKEGEERRREEDRVGLHLRHTKASRQKQKVSAELLQFL